MLTGGGRRTEKLFLYFSFYKTPENTDSLPLDFTLTWKVQLQAWRWLAPQDAELCRISQSFWQVVVFSVEILSENQNYLQNIQSLRPLSWISPWNACEQPRAFLHSPSQIWSLLLTALPASSPPVPDSLSSPSLLHFLTQPKSPLISPTSPSSILFQNCLHVSKL